MAGSVLRLGEASRGPGSSRWSRSLNASIRRVSTVPVCWELAVGARECGRPPGQYTSPPEPPVGRHHPVPRRETSISSACSWPCSEARCRLPFEQGGEPEVVNDADVISGASLLVDVNEVLAAHVHGVSHGLGQQLSRGPGSTPRALRVPESGVPPRRRTAPNSWRRSTCSPWTLLLPVKRTTSPLRVATRPSHSARPAGGDMRRGWHTGNELASGWIPAGGRLLRVDDAGRLAAGFVGRRHEARVRRESMSWVHSRVVRSSTVMTIRDPSCRTTATGPRW